MPQTPRFYDPDYIASTIQESDQFLTANEQKNYIINGNFDIWQRGTSSTNVGGYASADRWYVGYSNTNTSRQSFTTGQIEVPNNPKFFLRLQRTIAATVGNSVLEQRIELPERFSGKTLTFSFWAKANSSKIFNIDYLVKINSVIVVDAPNQSFTASTSWQKFTFTFNLNNFVSGTTLDPITDFLDFRVIESDASLSTFTLDIAQVMLNEGPVAAPFESVNPVEELINCQKFYYRNAFDTSANQDSSVYQWYGAGQSISTTSARFAIHLPVKMRKRPTVNGSGLAVSSSVGGTILATSIGTDVAGTQVYGVQITVASGLTVGQAVYLAKGNSTSHYLEFDAEL